MCVVGVRVVWAGDGAAGTTNTGARTQMGSRLVVVLGVRVVRAGGVAAGISDSAARIGGVRLELDAGDLVRVGLDGLRRQEP